MRYEDHPAEYRGVNMKLSHTYRPTPEMNARIEKQCAARNLSRSQLIRQLIEIGLDHLENEHYIDAFRLAALTESTQAMVDLIGRHLIPDEMEEVPNLVIARLEKYHVAI